MDTRFDRRAALAAIGAGLALGCAAPGFARNFQKDDRRMTRFALATRATPEGARPTIRSSRARIAGVTCCGAIGSGISASDTRGRRTGVRQT